MIDYLNKYRNKSGYIELKQVKKLQKLDLPTYGSRFKIWLKIDDELYLFKEGNNYFENIKEIINEELAKQINIKNASYDLAILDGKLGTISPDFKQGKEFIPFMFYYFRKPVISNDLVNFCNILNDMQIKEEIIFKMASDLFSNHLLDIFTAQRDRNIENLGTLDHDELSPRYDSAGSFLTIDSPNKIDNFISSRDKDRLLYRYKGYRTKFSLCPKTLTENSLDVLLKLSAQIYTYDSKYLSYVLSLLNKEMAKIYLLDFKAIFNYLKDYNIFIANYYQRLMKEVYKAKIQEYERKRIIYGLK